MTCFPANRAGGVQWQCASSAFSTCFPGEKGVVICRGLSRCSTESSKVDSKQAPSSRNSMKRKVAMWIGYVGTHFKGLQIQRCTAAGQTIEQELEAAIFRAGRILESNFGSLEKIQWMRSSRTDKGVHSLSTVISFKMEFDQESWRNDGDGIEIAGRINHFLPNTIRIFGIVPVNKSFDPRRACCTRMYHYLLPAATLGITDSSCNDKVERCLLRFQNILSSLEGHHPYHNYTVRSQYRKKRNALRKKNLVQLDAAEEEGNLVPSEEFSFEDDDFSNYATSELDDVPMLSSTSSCVTEVAENVPLQKIRWLHDVDIADKIFSAHFRRVFKFTCGGLEACQGLYFLKLIVHGESFMLHQIRKMVGTAIAIMRDVLPEDIIPISLSLPCRVALPLAPSDGLLLASNEFYPLHTNLIKPKDCEKLHDLPRLQMSTKVLKKKEEFWHNVLLPHMITLLQDSNAVWNEWLEWLEAGRISRAEMDDVRHVWRQWWLHSFKRRTLKGIDTGECALPSFVDGIVL